MAEECVIYDRECIDCGECDVCDLNPEKHCDNCGECIESKDNFRTVNIKQFDKKLRDKKQ